ncbi:vacuolar protein sorting-associated protein 41 homolog [Mytilus edulis]
MASVDEFEKTEDSTEEDESESDESEEEEEPKLKYERISNDLVDILKKDCISCLAVHSKFLAAGTHWGMIYILDHIGCHIRDTEITAHSTTVNQISIDDHGDYVASCSDDGKVLITGFYTAENNQSLNFDRPVKAVAMDPLFYKHGSGKHFVTGDDKLVLNEKGGLFSRHRTTALHQGEGPIREIQWIGDFIAWANDLGVKIYDMSTRSRITHIPREHAYRPELYRCNLCWRNEKTLLIGWADRVKVCVIKDRVHDDARNLPSRYVEIVYMFKVDFFVCGIAPLGTDLVMLTYDKPSEQGILQDSSSKRPQLQLITPHMEDYDVISSDALSLRGYEEYKCNDYHLECLPEENLFYIVSPKDIIVSKLRDEDDHVTWLIDHEQYEEALAVVQQKENTLQKHNLQSLGKDYLDFLLSKRDFEKAAQLCVKILSKNKDSWEEQVYKFAKIKQLKAIAPYIPRENPVLDPAIYEMVLLEFLLSDAERFLQLVRDWPSHLYKVQTVINALLDRLDRDRGNTYLMRALGDLYSYERQFDKALSIYLRLKHKDVFQLIHKHNLFGSISDKIVQLMEFDKEQAVSMLLDNMEKVPMEKVVNQLDKTPEYLFTYLDRIFQKDPHMAEKYHGKQVKLYAEYAPKKLLPFLKSSTHYPLQIALEECEMRNLIPEQVFLLGRMGNVKQALKLITEKLQDVNRAIEFCKDHNEPELWEDLIQSSLDKPFFIKVLLHNIGTHVDPIILIDKIQEGMEIEGLRDSLVKILQDYHLQISLREGCKKILVVDSFNLLDRLIKTQRKGIAVSSAAMCNVCQQRIVVNDMRYASDVIVFHCKHAFHEDCLPVRGVNSCPICSTQKRAPAFK